MWSGSGGVRSGGVEGVGSCNIFLYFIIFHFFAKNIISHAFTEHAMSARRGWILIGMRL